MMVAGIGCKKGVSCHEVLAAIDTAMAAHGLSRPDLTAIATGTTKAGEPGILTAAAQIGVYVDTVEDHRLTSVAARLQTHSQRSLMAAGTPSLSEAAALASAGDGARLLGPRTVVGHVTCALASREMTP